MKISAESDGGGGSAAVAADPAAVTPYAQVTPHLQAVLAPLNGADDQVGIGLSIAEDMTVNTARTLLSLPQSHATHL
jgi:hypothetical protein